MSLSYDLSKPANRTAEEEWDIHTPGADKFFEWHYITAPMVGANGHTYFLFISNLNSGGNNYRKLFEKNSPAPIPQNLIPYMTISHLSDYETGLSKAGSTFMLMPENQVFDKDRNSLTLAEPKSGFKLDFSYQEDHIVLKAKTKDFTCELYFRNAKQVLWMKDSHNRKGLIQEGAPDDFSFYYSLPNLPFTGWLKYHDNDDNVVQTDVSGQGWIDRQWGDFSTKSWQWSSFRFADGDRVNLYSFANGYQVGAFQDRHGKAQYFDNFSVMPTGYTKTGNGIWLAYGWDYQLPIKDHRYHVQPLDSNDTVENPDNTFYEGLGKLLDQNGTQVGWAVNESMDLRIMKNGPYESN